MCGSLKLFNYELSLLRHRRGETLTTPSFHLNGKSDVSLD